MVAFSVPARADEAEAIARVTKMNKKAIEEYENLNFEEARKILKDALDVCTASGLDKHPIKARTHIHMGIVIFAGFKQKELALKQFRKALDIQPDIRLTKSLANPEIQAAFDEALAGAGSDRPDTGAPTEKKPNLSAVPPPSDLKTLGHEPVTQGQQGNAITITATVDASLGAEKVVLAYRPDGASDFLGREMKPTADGLYSADIPVSATAGNLVAYYIEAQGKDGQPIAAKGSVADPIIVTLQGAGAPERPRRHAEDEGEEGNGSRFYIGLQLGTGFGWTTGNGEVNVDDKINPPGFALAQLGHLAPELGYFIRPNLLLSVQGRLQLVTGTTALDLPRNVDQSTDAGKMEAAKLAAACGGDYVCSPANGAIAVMARLTWYFGTLPVRPFAGIAAGGGYIRHVAAFDQQKKCGSNMTQTCVDTVAAGPVLFGPDGGILYNLTKNIGLVLGVNTQLGFGHFTFNVDVNAGMAVQL
ncbi:MAG TPA: tetratricopeptide repeat protein [Polyangia bacterium]|nr:tetratricopeptide repeat protein [Polyangia bacterium]